MDIKGSKPRTVLATLLLGRNRVVSDQRLEAALWGEDPPATAGAQIQTYVSRLRQVLSADVRIIRQRPGYLLRIRPDQFDLVEFERLAAQGHTEFAAQRFDEAAGSLRAALAVWRGPALAGVSDFLLESERAWLDEARLAALGDRIEADLRRGRHAELIPELVGLVSEFPLLERLRGQLMTALYRCGRQAEALAVYADCRRVLDEELGIYPGLELQQVQEAILANAPELEFTTAAAEGPAAAPAPTGRLLAPLPQPVADFTGRDREIGTAEAMLTPREDPAGRPAVVAVTGMAGVGKTSLAVHLAHRLRERYPDGVLYLDPRGADPDPPAPEALLTELLRTAVGGPLPAGLDELVRRYHELLRGRRVLVVLDNVRDERQARPLLPVGAGCGALVTSRARLPALDGVHALEVGVFEPGQALELLARIAGQDRTTAEPQAAQRVVSLCGYLPLGVRIAGARLAAKPYWPVARLAARLGDQHRRLDELRLADLEVRASVVLSYQGLAPAAQRAFRLLSLLTAADFPLWTAAVLLDVPVAATRDLLEQLLDARLLEISRGGRGGQDRYRFHDLVRALAVERAAAEETAEERSAALDRVLGA